MAAIKIIPSLSVDGWVTSPEKILDYLISYYILTDYQQSYLYYGALISLPYTYHNHNTDPDGFASAINSDITNLLNRYFPKVDVATRTAKDSADQNVYTVFLSAVVVAEDGRRYEINKITQLVSSKAKKIIDFSNNGQAADYFTALIN